MQKRETARHFDKRTLLLIIGGVFCIALAVWFSANERLVWVPKETGRLANDRRIVDLVVFSHSDPAKKFLASLANAASSTSPTQPGGFSMDEMDVYIDRTASGSPVLGLEKPVGAAGWRLAIVDRSADGIGSIRSPIDGRVLPMELKITGSGVILKVGREFRGWMPSQSSFDAPRRAITFIPDSTQLFLYEVSPASVVSSLMKRLMEQGQTTGGSFPLLFSQLTGPTELLMLAPQGASGQVFVLHAQSASTSRLPIDRLDAAAKEWIGEVDPNEVTVQLQDQSISIEKRSSARDVQMDERKTLPGIVKTFTKPKGKFKLVTFETTDGGLWMSNNTGALEGVLLKNIGLSSRAESYCGNFSPNSAAIIYPQSLSESFGPLAAFIHKSFGFRAVGLALIEPESGLFTLCGYF